MDDFLRRQSTEMLVFSALAMSAFVWLFGDLSWRYARGRRVVAVATAFVTWAAGLMAFLLLWPSTSSGIEYVYLRNGVEVGRSTPESGHAVWAMAVATAAGFFGIKLLVRGFARSGDGTTGASHAAQKSSYRRNDETGTR